MRASPRAVCLMTLVTTTLLHAAAPPLALETGVEAVQDQKRGTANADPEGDH